MSLGREAYFPSPDCQGGWRRPASEQEAVRVAAMNRARLDEAFELAASHTRNGGLYIVRHGWLVYERSFGLGHPKATPNLASCGKSFTSIAMGIALREFAADFPDGLDQRVYTPKYLPAAAFPLADPRKADIKLGQLLAFTAGIRGNNPGYVYGRQVTLDPVGPDGWPAMVDQIALGKAGGEVRGVPFSAATLWCEPGSGYSYATASIHIVSIILRQITGMELDRYLHLRLGRPLGWGPWGYGYRNTPAAAHAPGGGGIALCATDMLRFGYLLLREGRWGDEQLVPAEYVRHCSSVSPYNPHFNYSLQFNVNSKGELPAIPPDAYWKTGSGGHLLCIIPSLDLVLWKLGGRDEQYQPQNTGLPLPADLPSGERQTNRTPAGDAGADLSMKVLELVVQACG